MLYIHLCDKRQLELFNVALTTMILVHIPCMTSRLSYTFKLIFNNLLGCPYKFCANSEEYLQYQGVKFSYGPVKIEGGLHFYSVDLLFESGIGNPHVQGGEYKGVKIIFPISAPEAILPYDPFAAAFFMVSRYEEYLPYMKDQYGRFPVFESLTFREGFLNRPVVNLWAIQVEEVIKGFFNGFVAKKPSFNFIPTYDIDQAWAYLSKGILRNAGAMAKLAYNGQYSEIFRRINVLMHKIPDPFDTYDYQFSLQKQYGLKPVYFILFSRRGRYDRNIPIQNIRFRHLIKDLADRSAVGIHPSFASNNNLEYLKEEVEELSGLLNQEIKFSRQHFLKLSLPETYRNLEMLEITHDFTMGFAARPGFRAGICTPFLFYDIDLERETGITSVPFALMDGTLRDYMNLSPEEAINQIDYLIKEVKAVSGTFVSIWHNESLSDLDRWKGWRTVYEFLLNKAMH